MALLRRRHPLRLRTVTCCSASGRRTGTTSSGSPSRASCSPRARGPTTPAACVVLRVADRAELYRVLAEDPYTTEGVATERVIREWNPTIGQLSAQ